MFSKDGNNISGPVCPSRTLPDSYEELEESNSSHSDSGKAVTHVSTIQCGGKKAIRFPRLITKDDAVSTLCEKMSALEL